MPESSHQNDFLPWWGQAWEQISDQIRQKRPAHALLLTGPAGLGKLDFAQLLANSLLCEQVDAKNRPCGSCISCRFGATGKHPDLLTTYLLEDKKEIVVDQIRALCAGLVLRSHAGGYKVAIIAPADRMNANAANSLLKTLEEPTDNTVLILVSERPGRLPATIRSRCQTIRIQAPARSEAIHWLQQQGVTKDTELLLNIAAGCPLSARKLANSENVMLWRERWEQLEQLANGTGEPLATAEIWAKDESTQCIHWMEGWVRDMIRVKYSEESNAIRNPDLRESFIAIGKKMDGVTLFRLLDRVLEANRLLATPVNKRLLIEEQLIGWTAATGRIR